MTKTAVASLMVMSFVIGSASAWWLMEARSEKEQGSLVVLHAVGVAGLCANALNATEQGRADVVRKMLQAQMASAVSEAAQHIEVAGSPGLAIPNLVEGLSRARQYAIVNGLPEVVEQCDVVLRFLARSNARA